jgi:hypothetical protein
MTVEGLLTVVVLSSEEVYAQLSQLSGARTRVVRCEVGYADSEDVAQMLNSICTSAEVNQLLTLIGGDLQTLRTCLSAEAVADPSQKPTGSISLSLSLSDSFSHQSHFS